MSGDVHVRFCESGEVRPLPATHPAKPPRFPYIGVLLCAGCAGMAAYPWMRYSYVWEVTPASLDPTALSAKDEPPMTRWPVGRYACLSGFICPTKGTQLSAHQHERAVLFFLTFTYGSGTALFKEEDIVRFFEEQSPLYVKLLGEGAGSPAIWVLAPAEDLPSASDEWVVTGRMGIVGDKKKLCLNATASRWHPASMAGLVVGAMGVFVFSLALRHWLRERRRFRGGTTRA